MPTAAFAAVATLGWEPNSEPDLEGYVVYRNMGKSGPPYKYSDEVAEDELEDPLHPRLKLTGLKKEKKYYVALTAYNTEGVESSYSNEVCVEVVNNSIQACSQAVSSSASGSSKSGGGGGCFISTASHKPRNNNLLFYFIFTLAVIGIGSYSYRARAGKR